jgi:GT2 family glycosyltransferase
MPADSLAILIVSYNGLELLRDCLASVFASPDPPPANQVVVVDNASSDGTADWLKSHYPQVTCIVSPTNRGFAGGNNIGFAHIRSTLPQCRYVALLNQDTVVKPGWAEPLVKLADARPEAGSIQCKLLFHPSVVGGDSQGPDLFNSAGNESHYLGFGFVSAYRKPSDQTDSVRPIAFCSGAAMLVRVSAVGRDELFPEEYFAYLEDAELGWRLRLAGYENLYCPESIVYHRYQFSRNPQLYYRLESNRWRLLLAYYRWPTLVLILPTILIMEAGLLFYFIKVGAVGQKLRSWSVLGEMSRILARRREAQQVRRLTDRQLTAPFIAKAKFPEVRNPLLTYLGNPVLCVYWVLARLVLWW